MVRARVLDPWLVDHQIDERDEDHVLDEPEDHADGRRRFLLKLVALIDTGRGELDGMPVELGVVAAEDEPADADRGEPEDGQPGLAQVVLPFPPSKKKVPARGGSAPCALTYALALKDPHGQMSARLGVLLLFDA